MQRGIPGTIGGAIYMNAGAYGKEIREVVKEVTCIDENLQVYTLQNENMNFSYRHSRFKEKKEIILEAILELERGNAKEIREKIQVINTFNISARYDDYKKSFANKCTNEYTAEQVKNIEEVQKWLKEQ